MGDGETGWSKRCFHVWIWIWDTYVMFKTLLVMWLREYMTDYFKQLCTKVGTEKENQKKPIHCYINELLISKLILYCMTKTSEFIHNESVGVFWSVWILSCVMSPVSWTLPLSIIMTDEYVHYVLIVTTQVICVSMVNSLILSSNCLSIFERRIMHGQWTAHVVWCLEFVNVTVEFATCSFTQIPNHDSSMHPSALVNHVQHCVRSCCMIWVQISWVIPLDLGHAMRSHWNIDLILAKYIQCLCTEHAYFKQTCWCEEIVMPISNTHIIVSMYLKSICYPCQNTVA